MIKSINPHCLRCACERRGFLLRKTRDRLNPEWNNGGYQIVNALNGKVVKGYNFEMTSVDVRNFLNDFDADEHR